ncbi:MAG TPA: hypothetical protein VGA45_14290, partial [Actinomycetota bacterium]
MTSPGQAPSGSEEALAAAGDPGGAGGPAAVAEAGALPPLPELAEPLLAGYLDAAVATLRASNPGDLPGQLRQYQS